MLVLSPFSESLLKMEEFYKKWFEKHIEKRHQDGGSATEDPQPSTSNSTLQIVEPKSPTDIIYETEALKLVVEKGALKRQKNFRIQDHLFYFKIVPKQANKSLPMLTDLYDFLHAALLHVLESIKTFYKPEDHNVAYLTLHQEPMVNGLNTGNVKICLFKFKRDLVNDNL